MRRAFLVLVAVTALAASAAAQSASYFGITYIRRGRGPDSIYTHRLRIRLSALDGTALRVSVERGMWAGDSGIALRWGDTLYAETRSDFGESATWLGHREGGGFVGELHESWAASGTLNVFRFAMNLAGDDSLPPTPAPSTEIRDSINAVFASQRLAARHAEVRAALHLSSTAEPSPAQPSTSDSLVSWIIGLVVFGSWLVPLGYATCKWLVKACRSAVSAYEAWRARRARARPVRARYAVPCPICRTANMEAARVFYAVRGRGLFTSLERRVVAGCAPCVRRAGVNAARDTLRHGLWSLGGLFAAPCVAAYDLRLLWKEHDRALIERLLREAGLEPKMIRLDDDGLVHAERARLNTHLFVCARIIWADGTLSPPAHAEALRFLNLSMERPLSPRRFEQLLNAARGNPPAPRAISPEDAAAIRRVVKRLVLARGAFSPEISAALHEVAVLIGLSAGDVADLLREIVADLRAARAGEDQARARANANADAGAKAGTNSGANAGAKSGGQQQGSTNGNAGSGQRRHRRPSAEELTRARAVLNVSASATFAEIERAYRAVISIWHPDRAGLDARKQREFTIRAQEIAWANETLRRAVLAQMPS